MVRLNLASKLAQLAAVNVVSVSRCLFLMASDSGLTWIHRRYFGQTKTCLGASCIWPYTDPHSKEEMFFFLAKEKSTEKICAAHAHSQGASSFFLANANQAVKTAQRPQRPSTATPETRLQVAE